MSHVISTFKCSYNVSLPFQMSEEETGKNCFSPQLDSKELNSNDGSTPSHDANILSDLASSSCITSASRDLSKMNRTFESVSSSDVLCLACKQLLYRPAVLNCGHGTALNVYSSRMHSCTCYIFPAFIIFSSIDMHVF